MLILAWWFHFAGILVTNEIDEPPCVMAIEEIRAAWVLDCCIRGRHAGCSFATSVPVRR